MKTRLGDFLVLIIFNNDNLRNHLNAKQNFEFDLPVADASKIKHFKWQAAVAPNHKAREKSLSCEALLID